MDKRKKTKNSLMGALKIRPKVIGIGAAVALLLMLILAPSGVAPTQDIRFTGTVTHQNPPEHVGAVWWNVTADEEISWDTLPPCDTLMVIMAISPPMGYIESTIDVGTRVEVYGSYSPADCKVSLNGESYYIKKVKPQAPAFTPFGLIALVSLLSAIAAVAIVRKRR